MRFSTAAVFVAAATLGGSVVSAIPVPNEETALAQLEARETALLIDSILEARGYIDGEVDVSKRLFRAMWEKAKAAVGLGGSQAQPPADPSAPVARSLDADLVERDEEVSAPAPRPKHHSQSRNRGDRRQHRNGKNPRGSHKNHEGHRKGRKGPKGPSGRRTKHAEEADPTAPTDATTAPTAAHAKGSSTSTSPSPVTDASAPPLTEQKARELEEFIEILRRAGDGAPEPWRRPQSPRRKARAAARDRARKWHADAVKSTAAGGADA
ncbi:hypothetical protein DFP72DRAFT_1048730 [Ephemerocybe angulata]|uniref:Uncharacterized protein n=1 Tax=Ephemerocybe angulata TaxID=980116 RepID=A0A8H6LZC9_9AGAR|nr:hypothetical protein DFP72DRAFT_1048730 [Tulosesus angulatus]